MAIVGSKKYKKNMTSIHGKLEMRDEQNYL
jgi:hypothetical protein